MSCKVLISLAVGAAAAGCQSSKGGCQALARDSVLLQVAQTHQGSRLAASNVTQVSSSSGVAGTCKPNDHVTCPYSGVRCSGNQCCPGTAETGGKNFVCPSASSLGPWPGKIPPRCQLLTKVADCTSAEAVTLPSSNAWRVSTENTQSGWAWDVRTLTLQNAAGDDLKLSACEAFSSGSVSDTIHGGISGYGAENAFNGGGAWWGGRKDANGKFFLGLRCEQKSELAQVQIQQGDSHYAEEVVVELLDDDGKWVPVQSASGLLGGRASTSADWSMESIYPNMDFVGCYVDDRERHLDAGPGTGSYGYGTVSCAEACKGFTYMALQHKGECWCGDSLLSEAGYEKKDDAQCGHVCVGEEELVPTRYCGGEWRNAIYRIGGSRMMTATPMPSTSTSSMLSTTPLPSTSTAATSATTTTRAPCKFRINFCSYGSFGVSTPPPADNWELMVDECTPDTKGGAYQAYQPPSNWGGKISVPECGLASPYYVKVRHYPDATCTNESDSEFLVFTDGQCGGGCCDIKTGACDYGCRGFLSPA